MDLSSGKGEGGKGLQKGTGFGNRSCKRDKFFEGKRRFAISERGGQEGGWGSLGGREKGPG